MTRPNQSRVRSRWWLAIVIAAALCGGWFAWRWDRSEIDGARRAAPPPSDSAAGLLPPPGEVGPGGVGRTEVPPDTVDDDAVPASVAAQDPAASATGLRVRAVGPDGEPVAGVAVEWVIRSKLGDVGDSPIRGATGEDGTLEIEDGLRFAEQAGGGDIRAAYVAALGLRCAMPFEEFAPTDEDDAPGVTWLDAAPEPGAVIDVEVPPHGFVRFTWDPPRDPRGGALDATWLQVRRRDGDHFPGWRWGGELDEGATGFTFGPVGLGWEVWGQLSVRGMEGNLGSASGDGPSVAGETVEVPIEIAEAQRDVVALTGRIVFTGDATRGRPAAWIRFGPQDADNAPIQSIALDGDQRFEVLIAREALPSSVTLMDNYSRTTWTGACAVPEHHGKGLVDLGDVRVAPLPEEAATPSVALVAGRVVDASCAPVPRAHVSAYGYASQVGGRARDPERMGQVGVTRADAEGRFELEASVRLARDELGVQVSADGFQRAPMTTTSVGARGLEIELTRGATVRFQVRVPHWALLMEKVSMRLGRVAGPRGDGGGMREDGALGMRFTGVPDGTHTFSIELGQGDWPLHTQEVEVAGADLDLGLIDLSDALRICPLRLVDAGGAPVTEGYAYVRAGPWAGGPGGEIDSVQVGDGGEVTFVVPREAEDLRVVHRTAGTATIPAHAIVRARDDGEVTRVEIVLGP